MTAPGQELQWSWENRPTPLRAVAAKVVAVVGVLGSVVTSLVGWGLWSAEQGSAASGLLGTVPGLLTAVTVVAVAFGFVKRGEDVVTPLADPRSNTGDQLVAKPGTAHIRTSTTAAFDADMQRRRQQPPS